MNLLEVASQTMWVKHIKKKEQLWSARDGESRDVGGGSGGHAHSHCLAQYLRGTKRVGVAF